MAYVRVRESCAVHWQGGVTLLRAGDKVDETDPLVRAFPMHFESDVEEATAAPGARRGAR